MNRQEKFFIWGGFLFLALDWCRRHWKLLLISFIALRVAFWVWVHLFSPQTRDLADDIAAARKLVSVEVLGGTYKKPSNSFDPPGSWYGEESIDTLTIRVRNGAIARINNVVLYCEGSTTKQPPDQDYAPVTKTDGSRTRLPSQFIAANSSEDVKIEYAAAGDGFNSFIDKVTCKITNLSFVEADFYRHAREMDKWGAAAVDDADLEATPTPKPVTYNGMDYGIKVAGKITNRSDNVVRSVTVQCAHDRDMRYEHDQNSFVIDDLHLGPKQSISVDHVVPAGAVNPVVGPICWVEGTTLEKRESAPYSTPVPASVATTAPEAKSMDVTKLAGTADACARQLQTTNDNVNVQNNTSTKMVITDVKERPNGAYHIALTMSLGKISKELYFDCRGSATGAPMLTKSASKD